jgi:hypothetical protein
MIIGIIVFLVIIAGVLYAISKKYLKLNSVDIPVVNLNVTKWYNSQGYPPEFIQIVGEVHSEQFNSISDFLNYYNKTYLLKTDKQISDSISRAYSAFNESFDTNYVLNTNATVTDQVIQFYKNYISAIYTFFEETNVSYPLSPESLLSPASSLF